MSATLEDVYNWHEKYGIVLTINDGEIKNVEIEKAENC